MKSERDREKTDGGTGGRTGRQAGEYQASVTTGERFQKKKKNRQV